MTWSEMDQYNRFAAHLTRRDVVPSSRIPRRDIVLRSVRPVLEARAGALGIVLDVGCGIACGAVYMNGLFERYVGVDFSEGMIRCGRDFTREVSNVDLVVASVKDLPISDRFADVVYVNGALHHMTDIPGVILALRRYAKPGAWLVAREPQRGNPVIQVLRWIRKRVDASYSSDQIFFTKQELIDILHNAGLKDIHIRYQGFLTPPMADVVLKPLWLTAPLARLLVSLEGIVETVMVGPLARLSWNVTAYARFPGKSASSEVKREDLSQ